MKKVSKRTTSNRNHSAGFTLIEVLISMFVITIGLLSLLSVLGLAVSATMASEEDGIAKQLAQDAFESIYTARDSANIQWSDVENTGAAGGIFVTGFQPVNQAGPDAIIGTADDSGAAPQTLTLPGPDGVVGTSDDVTVSLTNFRRQIAITDVTSGGATVANLRNITVTIQYTTPRSRFPKQYVLSGFVSQYR